MVRISRNVKLDIDCPACGKTSHPSLVRLRRYKHFRCTSCGQTTGMSGDALAKIEAAMATFEKELAKVELFVS